MHATRSVSTAFALAIVALMAPPARATSSAVVHPSVTTLRAAHGGRVLPFIEDDYARAVAEARARRVPLFIEAWAPW